MGENDDQLQWPMENRFIRLAVVDQDSDAVTRMSQSNNFVSSDSSTWQQPTSVIYLFTFVYGVVVKDIAIDAGGPEFDSRTNQMGHCPQQVASAATFLCCPGTMPRRWVPFSLHALA